MTAAGAVEAEISVASMIPRQPIEHGSRTWCSKFSRVWSSVTPRCADNRKPIIYHSYFTTECSTTIIDRRYTLTAFYDTKFPNGIFARSYFVSSAVSRVNVPGLRSICQSIAKFSKTIRFLRYCPTWPKNWCVRLNPRAHFTRYGSEPIDVHDIFIHVVCNALFFYNWRPTAVQASPVVVFFFHRNTVYREDYRLNTLNDRSLWESREASVIQSPTTATIRHASRPFETYCSVCSWRIHCFGTHRSPFSFFPFRECPWDSSIRSSESLKWARRRHVRHFTKYFMISLKSRYFA